MMNSLYSRRHAAMTMVAALATSLGAQAQPTGYPSKPVKVIVPFTFAMSGRPQPEAASSTAATTGTKMIPAARGPARTPATAVTVSPWSRSRRWCR